ncbi:Macrolide export ATP-binding/permease protein MacB [Massilia sp. Bi118]|uniref:ABC transporter permease n=1 Tax=Massilia sp. Bi118 TaxID=2822346 RepID=UPI001D96F494|nr:ABC transporter permease [Massilia sp. Bi118]CAH0220095.1 Macrolide export ATP-binding/permease protein MacB [Massilia sp. Bi118]
MKINLRDFRIGWRLLVKEPAFSAVVILGLAVGFCACFLLLGYVNHSLSYDRHVPQREQVYRLMQRWNISTADGKWSDSASLPARDGAIASGVPLQATSFISRDIDVKIGAHVQTINVVVVDPDFRRIFAPQVLAGDLDAALARPDALALTRETATKLFGGQDALGKTVEIGGQPYRVLAVLADQPAATTLPYASLAGSATTIWKQEYRQLVTTNWGSSHGGVYIKLGPGADPQAVADGVRRAMLASNFYSRQTAAQKASLNGRDMIDFRLGPLADAYLDPDIGGTSSTHADRKTIFGLAAVAILILVLAATNYVNLATVRTLRRQREIAVRKVLGASAGAVSRQFLAESVLVCLIATAIGLLLAWLLLPVFSDLVQRKLDRMFTPASLGLSVLLGALLGVLAGAYPTWSALKVRPTAALSGRGNAETAGGLWLRRVLTVMQFATAMGLTGMTLAVAWQTHYASTLDPGFDPGPLLVVRTSGDLRDANERSFRDALVRLPGVDSVGVTDYPVTLNFNSTALQRDGGQPIEINWFRVSPEFFGVYGLKPVAGRLYEPSRDKLEDGDKIVLNESGARKFGFASAQDAIGKTIRQPNGEDPMQVVGVAPDIRHRSAHEPMQPTVYFLSDRIGTFTVRSAHQMEAVQRAIEEMWPRYFPNDVIDVKRVDSSFALSYADDLRLAKLLAASSVIATAIAAFGIYVLAAYSVQRRAREIVLRKLYGAGNAAVGSLVMREFLALIGAGALIGLPPAWLAMQNYLAGFNERAPIGAWTIVGALLVAGAVALGSTLRHTVAAVRIRPALALRE